MSHCVPTIVSLYPKHGVQLYYFTMFTKNAFIAKKLNNILRNCMSLSSTIMGLPKNTFQNYLDIIMWELKIIEIFLPHC